MKTKVNQNKELDIQLKIHLKVEDEKTHEIQILKFEHTKHSYIRSSQRSIGVSKIAIALEYGQNFFKQGLIFYVLGEKDIPEFLSKEKNHLINTVVVTSGDSNQVITCYRSNNPFKKIKHKPNEIYRKYKTVA
jgi:hypothetical protein